MVARAHQEPGRSCKTLKIFADYESLRPEVDNRSAIATRSLPGVADGGPPPLPRLLERWAALDGPHQLHLNT